MATGKKVFAVITVKDGKPIVEVYDGGYKTITLKDGAVCIIENKSQDFVEVK